MGIKAWGIAEKEQWLAGNIISKSYRREVLDRLDTVSDFYRMEKYGALSYDPEKYPLYGLFSKNWKAELPTALVTAGVHGYETGGIYAALEFLETVARKYENNFNLVVVPCVSPWGFETDNRWNPYTVDPNRSFTGDYFAEESAFLKKLITGISGEIIVHIDLHETTDRDKTVFRPALAARDGAECINEDIPQGFYLVADEERPEIDFQNAVIRSVEKITPIAEKDESGNILAQPAVSHGVIFYPMRKLGLSGTLTGARYHTTTEVYPDGEWMTPDSSIKAQIAAITGGLDYIIGNQDDAGTS